MKKRGIEAPDMAQTRRTVGLGRELEQTHGISDGVSGLEGGWGRFAKVPVGYDCCCDMIVGSDLI